MRDDPFGYFNRLIIGKEIFEFKRFFETDYQDFEDNLVPIRYHAPTKKKKYLLMDIDQLTQKEFKQNLVYTFEQRLYYELNSRRDTSERLLSKLFDKERYNPANIENLNVVLNHQIDILRKHAENQNLAVGFPYLVETINALEKFIIRKYNEIMAPFETTIKSSGEKSNSPKKPIEKGTNNKGFMIGKQEKFGDLVADLHDSLKKHELIVNTTLSNFRKLFSLNPPKAIITWNGTIPELSYLIKKLEKDGKFLIPKKGKWQIVSHCFIPKTISNGKGYNQNQLRNQNTKSINRSLVIDRIISSL